MDNLNSPSLESGDNVAILATAADLVRCLVTEVQGNEISSGIKGEELSSEMISEMTLSIFSKAVHDLREV